MVRDVKGEDGTAAQCPRAMFRVILTPVFLFRCLQSKYAALQRRHEQTEMELMQARLVATAIEDELDDDDANGQSQPYFSLFTPMTACFSTTTLPSWFFGDLRRLHQLKVVAF